MPNSAIVNQIGEACPALANPASALRSWRGIFGGANRSASRNHGAVLTLTKGRLIRRQWHPSLTDLSDKVDRLRNADSICIENRGNGDREARQQLRRRQFAASIDACLFIDIYAQTENRDGFRLWVDDPVFRDAAFGIITSLINQVSFRFLFTDNFLSEVGAEPEAVLPARIGGRKQ